ncbi:GTPase-activating protein GYP5 [Lentinula edodes]|uniref:GTPase-activating protein GYP5 n=1 Tax=Lentinula edodes TaxID=5353 RepID=A0A1Q3EN57_LENED|nr:GTPase-activating protein GYP5 [Lentinula edodes]
MLPLSLLNAAQNKPMLVELKNGETYVYQTNSDGDRFWKLKECYIRGSTIKYLRIPDTLLDAVKEEQVRAREVGRSTRGTGPGNRGGRGAPMRGREVVVSNDFVCVCDMCIASIYHRRSARLTPTASIELSLYDEKMEDLDVSDSTVDQTDSTTPAELFLPTKPFELDLNETHSGSTSSHKKSASLATLHSGRHISLLVNHDEQAPGSRVSLDGQHKLQEEFARLQKEKDSENLKGPPTPGFSAGIDWDFWGAVISDYQQFASERSDELAQAIAKGIPPTLRGMMWQLMAASKDPELESTYLKLLKESSIHEKAILRDLGRTFPHHDFFTDGQGIGQENLYNVLKAYSIYDPQVGYCQGLPFVVAILLLNMPDEEAFSLLVRLMQVYDLRGHFLPEMPKLQLRLFQFDRLIEELLPVLHVHFLREGIKSSMFCSQWFLTMFSYRFPLDIVFRIYDNCLASGIEAIFGFSIALLRKNEDLLLNLKFDEILAFLNTRLFDRYKAAKKKRRYNINHEYEDMVREKNKHTAEIDELQSSNRALSAQVKRLESNFAQLNVEHVELLNELVKARLRNEEMEGELVRYKLLYAEAMHENEDAQSSHPLPGTLPRLNRKCLDLALRAAFALRCSITQHYSPFAVNGQYTSPKIGLPIRIKQIQLEQDTAKSITNARTRTALIDLNRAGAGLLEIVTEPDFRTAGQAAEYVRSLQELLRAVGVSDGNMEAGSLRCDVNVSINRPGEPPGMRTEVKNINSIKFMVAAIEYEIQRQKTILETLGPKLKVPQETRGFNSETWKTFKLRSKEDAPDYRYMPDPNLGVLVLRTYRSTYDGVVEDTVVGAVAYFELCSQGRDPKFVMDWIIQNFLGQLFALGKPFSTEYIPVAQMGDLLDLITTKQITRPSAKLLLKHMLVSPSDTPVRQLAQKMDVLSSVDEHSNSSSNDDSLRDVCIRAIDALPSEIAAIQAGNENVMNKVIGWIMRQTKGKVDVNRAKDILKQQLLSR